MLWYNIIDYKRQGGFSGLAIIELCKSSEEYFSELLDSVVAKQGVVISDEVKYYLSRMLSDNINPENLLKATDDNPYAETPLAILFHESLNAGNSEQKKILRFIGDYALYVSGFFSESLNKSLVDVDYYIEIGGSAYNSLSGMFRSKDIRRLYDELYVKFAKMVELLTEISYKTGTNSCTDLLRLYERWIRTGSATLEKLLQEKGIVVDEKKLKIA
jgi:hypothetical protein